jgi:hypothetical protein
MAQLDERSLSMDLDDQEEEEEEEDEELPAVRLAPVPELPLHLSPAYKSS